MFITKNLTTPELQQKIEVLPYSTSLRTVWNDVVAHASSATFLHFRDYMEYHLHRFDECSVVVRFSGEPVAVFPACREDEGRVVSYGGLTYGGLLWIYGLHSDVVLEIMTAIAQYYAQNGMKALIYKSVPHIYRIHPDEIDLYWLWKQDSRLLHRQLSSALLLNHSDNAYLSYNTLRKRKVKQGFGSMLHFKEADKHDEWADFWQHLSQELWNNHQKKVVHSLEELLRLKQMFPERIRLFVALDQNPSDGDAVCAGMVIFETDRVIHAQYIMVSDKGRSIAALDYLIDQVFTRYRDWAKEKDETVWFDFGISSEGDGTPLNRSLLFQKEGFGARSVCYDTYETNLETLIN